MTTRATIEVCEEACSSLHWASIRQPGTPIAITARALGAIAREAADLAARSPFERRGEGPVEAAVAQLGSLPPLLAADIRLLARRFAEFMGVATVRIRLEGVTTNACRKVHSDYTDVRLITTYCGPGTDYLPLAGSASEADLVRLPTGHVALFKGRLFADDHAPCLHRSPPVADTGERRLVLVIDTPMIASL